MTQKLHEKGLAFRKMHGLGNDFVVIDARNAPLSLPRTVLARIADRRFGIGCDQLILLENSARADAFMRIFNPDGGEVGACGNATRCIGWLLAQEKGARAAIIETKAGLLHATLAGDDVAVDMGLPALEWARIPLAGNGDDTVKVSLDTTAVDPRLPPFFSAVNMGNPHAVFFVPDAEAFNLAQIGPKLETDPIFPQKANISLAQKVDENRFLMRVWERAAGVTLACGTAACAVAVAAARTGLGMGNIRIDLPGGSLAISRTPEGRVIMTGPIATSFEGVIDPSLLYGHDGDRSDEVAA